MEVSKQSLKTGEMPPKAKRAVRIIYTVMAAMMLLPFILAWFSGAIRF